MLMAGGGGVTITGAEGGLGKSSVWAGVVVVGDGGGVPGFFSGLDWTWTDKKRRTDVEMDS